MDTIKKLYCYNIHPLEHANFNGSEFDKLTKLIFTKEKDLLDSQEGLC